MKEFLKDLLKDHVKDKKLDEFGTLVVSMLLISMMTTTSNDIAEVLLELGVEKNDF